MIADGSRVWCCVLDALRVCVYCPRVSMPAHAPQRMWRKSLGALMLVLCICARRCGYTRMVKVCEENGEQKLLFRVREKRLHTQEVLFAVRGKRARRRSV